MYFSFALHIFIGLFQFYIDIPQISLKFEVLNVRTMRKMLNFASG